MACAGCGERREIARRIIASSRARDTVGVQYHMNKMTESISADVARVGARTREAFNRLTGSRIPKPEGLPPPRPAMPPGKVPLRVKSESIKDYRIDSLSEKYRR